MSDNSTTDSLPDEWQDVDSDPPIQRSDKVATEHIGQQIVLRTTGSHETRGFIAAPPSEWVPPEPANVE